MSEAVSGRAVTAITYRAGIETASGIPMDHQAAAHDLLRLLRAGLLQPDGAAHGNPPGPAYTCAGRLAELKQAIIATPDPSGTADPFATDT